MLKIILKQIKIIEYRFYLIYIKIKKFLFNNKFINRKKNTLLESFKDKITFC